MVLIRKYTPPPQTVAHLIISTIKITLKKFSTNSLIFPVFLWKTINNMVNFNEIF